MEPYKESQYDPYADPDPIDTLEVVKRWQVDEWLKWEREDIHSMKEMHEKQDWKVNMWARKFQDTSSPYLTAEEREAVAIY